LLHASRWALVGPSACTRASDRESERVGRRGFRRRGVQTREPPCVNSSSQLRQSAREIGPSPDVSHRSRSGFGLLRERLFQPALWLAAIFFLARTLRVRSGGITNDRRRRRKGAATCAPRSTTPSRTSLSIARRRRAPTCFCFSHRPRTASTQTTCRRSIVLHDTGGDTALGARPRACTRARAAVSRRSSRCGRERQM